MVSVLAGRVLVREMREGSIGFGWWRSQPVKGAVNRGSSDAEQLGEFGLGVGAEVMQLEQMLGLVQGLCRRTWRHARRGRRSRWAHLMGPDGGFITRVTFVT